jgi:hypothetical protein
VNLYSAAADRAGEAVRAVAAADAV